MDEKDWLMLQSLHKEKSLTRAAERMYMTQPALTYRLQQLEKKFGVPLIMKRGKRIKFTPEGEYLVTYAYKMLAELRDIKDHIVNMQGEVQGTLRIGASIYFGQHELPLIIKNFPNLYPNVQIHVDTGFSSEIFNMLLQEEIQVGIIRGEFQWLDQKHLIHEENICLVSTEELDLEELPSLPRINYRAPKQALKLGDQMSFSLGHAIDQWWHERYREPPTITMQVDSYETCKEMVKLGLGYTIIPKAFVRPNEGLHTVDLTLKDGQTIKRRTWMLYREATLQFTVVDRFVQFMKGYDFQK
ncbi:putative HTH-type transcriptional regulator YraN [Marinithermofilum abyssi]|uniref:Putative HTH-type transcriptional regulator YraN n=1 Tax=Marinithermofilum abyssi TaxID=1571185 RepID=A0A8J2YDM3_9BACL|nr:LysR family transcriptional regulator [Marinithermofilum abyssi]GGE11892.1 putative HTH-type transcriptional regulator YraN [Marinithermofilum abyssi]